MLLRGLILVAGAVLFPFTGHADTCPIVQPHPLTAPQIAMMRGNTAEAESLYRAAIAKNPGDNEATAGLVEVLLTEQKPDEAAATVDVGLKKDPQSPALLTALAAVQHKQGLPWEEAKTLNAAQAHGICYAPLHRALADYMRFTSMYASALQQIQLAHQLDPYDPRIVGEWRQTLPLAQRIAELKKYLAGAGDADRGKGVAAGEAKFELAILEARQKNESGCQVVSPIAKPTDTAFTPITAGNGALRGWGLDVAVNGRKSQLLIDTGASGIYINSSLAKKAKLQRLATGEQFGIGDQGPQTGYVALADSIKIGKLEFRNCLVEVSDRRAITGIDGLIGTDVFSQFLVTLDFPRLRLTLAPLPSYPGGAASPEKLNTGAASAVASSPTLHDRYIAPEMKDWLEVYRRGHALIIPGMMDGKRLGLFLIDTGANGSAISTPAALAVTKIHIANGAHVTGVSGQVKDVYYASDFTLRFGKFEQKSARIPVFDLSGMSRSFGMEISGMLGEDTLSRLVVSIDYRDGLIKFQYQPNRGYQSY